MKITRLPRIILLFLSLVVCLLPSLSFSENTKQLEQIDFANGLLQRGFYDMAREEYQSFISGFPGSKYLEEARFGLPESLFYLGMYKEAASGYSTFIKAYPQSKENAIAHLRIAQAYFKLDYLDKALKMLDSIDEVDSEDIRQGALYYRGMILQKKGKKQEALDLFIKATDLKMAEKFRALSFLEAAKIVSFNQSLQEAYPYYKKAYENAGTERLKRLILFEKGEMEFLNKNYKESINIFQEILSTPVKDDISHGSFVYLITAFYNLKEYEKVIAEYEKNLDLISVESESFDAYSIISSSYQELFRFPEAIGILDKLLLEANSSLRNREKIFFKKADIMISSKDYSGVIQMVEEDFGENIKNNPQALFVTAEAYYELGKFGIAYSRYQEISDRFPDSKFKDESLYSMAYCWLAMNRDEQARGLFLKYFQQGENNEKRQDALYNVIIIEKKHKLIEKAIEHSQEYVREFSEGKLREDVIFQLAVFYSDLNQNKKAIELLIQFTNRFDKSLKLSEAYFLLAYNLQLSEDYDRALKYYKRAIDSNNSGRDILYSSLKNSAFIYLKKGKEKKAVQLFQKIIDDFKDSDIGLETYFWLIQYYLDAEQFTKSLEVVEKVEKNPGISQYFAEISYLKGETNKGLGNYQKAIGWYDLVLSRPDKNERFGPAAHIGKGLCFKMINQADKAKQEFEAAITESPNDYTVTMRARYETAAIEYIAGNKNKAAKLYMLIAVLYDDQQYVPSSLKRAGEIFEELGQKENAVYAYQEILKDYPENQAARIVKERVKKINAD